MPIISIEVKKVRSVISQILQVKRFKSREVKKSPKAIQISVKGSPVPEYPSTPDPLPLRDPRPHNGMFHHALYSPINAYCCSLNFNEPK